MSELIKDTIQDCNVNFLVGSGASFPFLKTLGNIETLLSELEVAALPTEQKLLIRASLYLSYFNGVIGKNSEILEETEDSKTVLGHYHGFLRIWNSILLKRKSTILGKEINIFTTNVDIFLEKALEDLGLEYNDGFNGRFKPSFSLSNFKKSRFKKSLHYDNVAEIPVFNLLKLHGSLCWDLDDDDDIVFSRELVRVKAAANQAVPPVHALSIAAQQPQVLARLGEKQRCHRLAELTWKPEDKPAWLDETAYAKQVHPKLANHSISRIAMALGVSLPYASDIRAGRRRPHPRHWLELAKLANVIGKG